MIARHQFCSASVATTWHCDIKERKISERILCNNRTPPNKSVCISLQRFGWTKSLMRGRLSQITNEFKYDYIKMHFAKIAVNCSHIYNMYRFFAYSPPSSKYPQFPSSDYTFSKHLTKRAQLHVGESLSNNLFIYVQFNGLASLHKYISDGGWWLEVSDSWIRVKTVHCEGH